MDNSQIQKYTRLKRSGFFLGMAALVLAILGCQNPQLPEVDEPLTLDGLFTASSALSNGEVLAIDTAELSEDVMSRLNDVCFETNGTEYYLPKLVIVRSDGDNVEDILAKTKQQSVMVEAAGWRGYDHIHENIRSGISGSHCTHHNCPYGAGTSPCSSSGCSWVYLGRSITGIGYRNYNAELKYKYIVQKHRWVSSCNLSNSNCCSRMMYSDDEFHDDTLVQR